MNSPAQSEFVTRTIDRVLSLLETGTQLSRANRSVGESHRSAFYSVKDSLMEIVHQQLEASGHVRYFRVPYLRRCRRCKGKADELQGLDPSRSWEYHLQSLPVCSADVEVPARAMVEQRLPWEGRELSFMIPQTKARQWGLDVARLEQRVWVPEAEFSSGDGHAAQGSLADITEELRGLEDAFRDSLQAFAESPQNKPLTQPGPPPGIPVRDVGGPVRVVVATWFAQEDRMAVAEVLEKLSADVTVVGDGEETLGRDEQQPDFESLRKSRLLLLFLSKESLRCEKTLHMLRLASMAGRAVLPLHLEPLFVPEALLPVMQDRWVPLYDRKIDTAVEDIRRAITQLLESRKAGKHGRRRTGGRRRHEPAEDKATAPPQTGPLEPALVAHTGPVRCLRFDALGRRMISAAEDGTVRVWHPESDSAPICTLDPGGRVWSADLSPDGQRAIYAGDDGCLQSWDLATGRPLQQFAGHAGRVTTAVFSADGGTILSAGRDCTVRLFAADSGEELLCMPNADKRCVWCAVWAPPAPYVLTAGRDKIVRVWNLATGEIPHQLVGHKRVIRALAVSSDGRLAASGGRDCQVLVWDLTAASLPCRLTGHSGAIKGIAFLPCRRHLLSASDDATVRLWSLEHGCELARFVGHRGRVLCLASSPDGTQAISSGDDMLVLRWSVPGHHAASAEGGGDPTCGLEGPPSAASFNADSP